MKIIKVVVEDEASLRSRFFASTSSSEAPDEALDVVPGAPAFFSSSISGSFLGRPILSGSFGFANAFTTSCSSERATKSAPIIKQPVKHMHRHRDLLVVEDYAVCDFSPGGSSSVSASKNCKNMIFDQS